MQRQRAQDYSQYTSTGFKLLKHPVAMQRAAAGMATPLVLQVAPTAKCNLSCHFCSHKGRAHYSDLSIDCLRPLILALRKQGLRAVELTGGGDPLLYPNITELSNFIVSECGLKLGIITNGILLHRLQRQTLDLFHWIRISANFVDLPIFEATCASLPAANSIKGTLACSYVWGEESTPESIENLKALAIHIQPEYVRLLVDCFSPLQQQRDSSAVLSWYCHHLGDRFFHQYKEFQQSIPCLWCHYKPFVMYDGNVYPCNSLNLQPGMKRSMQAKYKWCTIEELPSKYTAPMQPYKHSMKCSRCPFLNQNALVHAFLNSSEMDDFI